MSKDSILEAAAAIFSQKGYHAASMQDIAQAVQLRKASLYYHVNSKQEILLALLDKGLDLLIAEMQEVMAQPHPPDEKLRLAVRTYLQTMLDHRALASVLLLEHRSLEPELRARHITRRDRFESLWRDLIQDGVEAGVFKASDPSIESKALLGVLNWTITWYRPEGTHSPEDIADRFTYLFLYGLVPREEVVSKA
ncbi:MAG: TetR/AcrR family transcriptional regulator [Chloroflexota bacterium]|nr:TetR/AcrR family transcriptional regulator [Chloroflexota bacterium]